MDAEFAGIKTGFDFFSAKTSVQEKFEAKYPEKARQLEAEFRAAGAKGRAPTFAPAPASGRQ